MNISVTITGIAALLQHRFVVDEEDPIANKHSGFKDYSDDVKKSLYLTEDGKLCQTADQIMGSMIKAAVNFKIPGKGKKTYKDLTKAALIVTPEYIPHKIQTWRVDRRGVRIGMARIIRERPRLDEWELDFSIEAIDKQFPFSAIKDILDEAGKFHGIGDFRPRFGRFTVTSFREIK